MLRLPLVVLSGGYSPLWCAGFSLRWLLLLRTRPLGPCVSVVVAHGLSCPVACGIFPDQGLNPCSLHWQVDSYPLYQQGSPRLNFCEPCKVGVQFHSFADDYPVFPTPFVEETVLSPLSILVSPVKC